MGNEDFLSSHVEIAETTGQPFTGGVTANSFKLTDAVNSNSFSNHRHVGTHASYDSVFDDQHCVQITDHEFEKFWPT